MKRRVTARVKGSVVVVVVVVACGKDVVEDACEVVEARVVEARVVEGVVVVVHSITLTATFGV
jgi:hypothetical protein